MPPIRQNRSRGLSSTSSTRMPPSRLENVRIGVQGMFAGRSSVGRPRRGSAQTPESPKLPEPLPHAQPILELGSISSSRLELPYLDGSASQSSQTRPNTRSQNTIPTPLFDVSAGMSLYPHSDDSPITSDSRQQGQQSCHTRRPEQVRRSERRVVGADAAEQRLADLTHDARVRRHRRKGGRAESRWAQCGPKMKNRKILNKIFACFISGIFLTLILSIYLALALSNKVAGQEFHILLILIILVTTIFFCHALIRLCMMLINPPDDTHHSELPEMTGPGGYANPASPLRVTLVRDEEAAGIESEATKFSPPAYGLWRESVRVDPNRIFWQRNERQESGSREEPRPAIADRPPSYISEEGIDYVIEAQPPSIAPTTDVPLPQHPSEIGRVWHGP
ncbi:hypothetical protein BJ878DRAFT_32658 [Calycina marina]|uniref:Uncharacterized protein n=1 Tax=Calycina marina TaxID=1763456 RepID=A0A9P7Z4L7_9HELO|nr:hypothetical protein BJ878DRAFT_32658 [Calycina marina]